MGSRSLQPVIALLCIGALISIVFAGCGSATLDEYEREVTELNEHAAEKMAEVSEALPAGAQEEDGAHEEEESHEDEGSREAEGPDEENESHETEGEEVEALIMALEEAIESLKMVILELEDVKVPEGMEEFHRSLLAFYQGNLSVYEALLSTLEPVEEHGEEEAAHGGEETEEHEEASEEVHEEDASHDEETSGEGH